MTPKRIWLINQDATTPETGYGGRTYYLGRELARQGHQVNIVAASYCHHLRNNPSIKATFETEKVDGIHFTRVKTPKYSRPSSPTRVLSWFVFSWRLRKLDKFLKGTPDIILFSSPPMIGYLGAEYLAKKLGCRLVFEVRDIWPLTLCEIGGYSPRHPFIRFMQWVEDRAYKNADYVVSNLKNSYRHMQERGLDTQKFIWVPNGYLQEEVDNRQELSQAVVEKLPQRRFVVGYTGTIGLANAMDVLLDAAKLLKADEDIAFVLVGKGAEVERYRQFLADNNMTNVSFIEAVPKAQVQSVLSYFDATYIGWHDMPLYRFGIGANKLPEYLYAAKPILHSYSGSCDPVAECEAGITIPAGDPKALAEAIVTIKNMSEEERSMMGEKANHCARENYEYGILATKLAEKMFE